MRTNVKLMMAALLVLALAPAARAQWLLPADDKGIPMTTSNAPCIPYHIDNTTGTAEVTIVGSSITPTGNTVTKSYGYVAWVMLSTGTATQTYLAVSDTDKRGSGDVYDMIPPLTFLEPLAAGSVDTGKVGSKYIQFRPPMIFQNGLTAKLSAAGLAATVCYRKIGGPQVP